MRKVLDFDRCAASFSGLYKASEAAAIEQSQRCEEAMHKLHTALTWVYGPFSMHSDVLFKNPFTQFSDEVDLTGIINGDEMKIGYQARVLSSVADLWCGREACTFFELVKNCMDLYGGWPAGRAHISTIRYDTHDASLDVQSADESDKEDVSSESMIAAATDETSDEQPKCYAGGQLAKSDFVTEDGKVVGHALDEAVVKSFLSVKYAFEADDENFIYRDGALYGIRRPDGTMPKYITAGDGADPRIGAWVVWDDFYRFLASCESWMFANGAFERQMANRVANMA